MLVCFEASQLIWAGLSWSCAGPKQLQLLLRTSTYPAQDQLKPAHDQLRTSLNQLKPATMLQNIPNPYAIYFFQ